MSNLKGTAITWLGHATVLVTTPQGTNLILDPFIEQSPTFPKGHKLPDSLDLVLVTHGHFDHISDAAPLAKKYGCPAVGVVELTHWLTTKGVKDTVGMNLGGAYTHKDVTISMVEARHTSGIQDGNDMIYGGVPAGFILEIEHGPVLYHAGDTALFSDMKLIGELYSPELAMLPIGGHFTMGPKHAAMAARFLGVKTVLPIHFGTFPPLTGTPAQLEEHLKGSGITVLKPRAGETLK